MSEYYCRIDELKSTLKGNTSVLRNCIRSDNKHFGVDGYASISNYKMPLECTPSANGKFKCTRIPTGEKSQFENTPKTCASSTTAEEKVDAIRDAINTSCSSKLEKEKVLLNTDQKELIGSFEKPSDTMLNHYFGAVSCDAKCSKFPRGDCMRTEKMPKKKNNRTYYVAVGNPD